jgi:serine/threonine-protein kinase RsbW
MIEKLFPAQEALLNSVHSFINTQLEKTGGTQKARLQIEIAAEEVFVNICRYAYPEGNGTVRIGCAVTGDPPACTVRFSDKGLPFNPLSSEDPDISAALHQRKPGGLGIFLAKKIMDDIRYEYKDGENVLTLIKKL